MEFRSPAPRLARLAIGTCLTLSACSSLLAQVPAGYYNSVDTSSPAALRLSLHQVIDDHQRFPYTSTSTDTWNILELADEDPNNPNNVLDVYRNASFGKVGAGNTLYNREHTWPKSYGFPNDGSTNYPYTDCHQLFITDDGYNSARSNKPYGFCDASCTEEPTLFNAGQGGGTGVYPGNSNWTMGSLDTGTWETWGGRRGDVARALLYLDVRYEGGTHAVTGAAEPNLILTDNVALIASSNTGSNLSVAYMGLRSVLLQWHAQDPPDAVEMHRNDVVYSFQGNRNPFVDHPEWVDCVFSSQCGDTTPPAVPAGLSATAGNGLVSLDWNNNGEPDLSGYHVYRATTSGGPYTKRTTSPITTSAYQDTPATNGTTYHYVVSAIDVTGNESGFSAQASATPQGGGGGGAAVWINEFHYDNSGTDSGEIVEIAGPAGTSLTGWKILGYNGADGSVYKTVNLSGTIANQQNGYGARSFAFSGMQNGAPDGLALVNASNVVVQFLSYEGTFAASSGAAAGMTSQDVGVSETTSTTTGFSLQLSGTGNAANEFTWQAPQNDTPGVVNVGQTFSN